MGFQLYLRVHSSKGNMVAVILAGPLGVKKPIVGGAQIGAALRVFENPIPERLVNSLRFLLGNSGVLGVEDANLLSVLIFAVIYPRVPLVQKVLKNGIGVLVLGSIGGENAGVVPFVLALACYIPFAGDFIVGNIYFSISQMFRRLEQFKNKLPVILRLNPRCANTHTDFSGGQVFGLHLFQLFYVDSELRVYFGGGAGMGQLHTNIARQVFVRRLPALVPICALRPNVKGAGGWVFENDALQILHDLRNFLGAAHEGGHKAQIHTGPFPNRYRQGLRRCVHAGHSLVVLDGPFGEHIRFVLKVALIVQHFQGAEQGIRRILIECQTVSGTVQNAVFLGVGVVEAVKGSLLRLDLRVRCAF